MDALLLLGGVLAGVVIGVVLVRARSSTDILARLTAAEHGDLDSFLGETCLGSGSIAKRAGALLRTLRSTIMDVQLGSQDLCGAGESILEAIAQQARGAAEQSAAASQTSAAVEEMNASAHEAVKLAEAVAATAREADRIAAEGVTAVDAAEAGIQAVRQNVNTMASNILALAEQTQHIESIISSVGEIADQSQMLALNAAIEATRAGAHGNGFAIVAAEIRALANQSKAATFEVRRILSDVQRLTNAAVSASQESSSRARSGSELVERAGATIAGLAEINQQASASAQQIAAAVRQHGIGMEQIETAMFDIIRATEQNLQAGAATEQAARALITLSSRLTGSLDAYHATPTDEDLDRLSQEAEATAESEIPAYPMVGFDFSAVLRVA